MAGPFSTARRGLWLRRGSDRSFGMAIGAVGTHFFWIGMAEEA